jgi:hypothetical protein
MPPYSSPLASIAHDLPRQEGGQSVTERNVEGTAHNDHGRGGALEAERVAALANLFEAEALPGLDDVAAPMYWPDLSTTTSFPGAGSGTTATWKHSSRCATKNGSTIRTPRRAALPWSGTERFVT